MMNGRTQQSTLWVWKAWVRYGFHEYLSEALLEVRDNGTNRQSSVLY